jgi:hypothetical protein
METKIADCPLGAKCEDVKTEGGKPVLYRCPWYVQVKGFDPNTGEEKDQWGCAISWMPALMINAANESRKGAAATESFRNEMVRQGEQTQKIMLVAAQIAEGRQEKLKLMERAEICD